MSRHFLEHDRVRKPVPIPDRVEGMLFGIMLSDELTGIPAEAARYRPPYRSAWSKARRGQAIPGSRADRHRAPASAWRRSDATRAVWPFRASRARRAAAPW